MVRNLSGVVSQFTPSLFLDFTKGVMPAGLTYIRAGNSTRINAAGVLENVGANVPRFDYDPTSLTSRGILLDNTSTNLCIDSATLSAPGLTSSGAGDSTTAGYGIGIQGGSTTMRIITGIQPRTLRLGTGCGINNTATAYCVSFFYRGTLPTAIVISARAGVGTSVADLGVIGPYGLRRAYAVITSGNNASVFLDLNISANANFEIGDIQVEQGLLLPSSYIPTTTTTVLRNADDLRLIVGPWFNSKRGTWVGEAEVPYAAQGAIIFSQQTGGLHGLIAGRGNIYHRFEVEVTSGYSNVGAVTTKTNSAIFRCAGRYVTQSGQTSVVEYASGSQVTTNSVAGSLIAPTSLYLGGPPVGVGLRCFWLRKLWYYPTDISNALMGAYTL